MKKVVCCLFLILVSFGLAWTQDKQPAPPRSSEAAFSQQREQLSRQFEQEKQRLQAQFQALGQEVEDLKRRIQQAEQQHAVNSLTLALLHTSGKILGFGLLHVFSLLLFCNLLLYLYFKEKPFFNRYKIVIIIVAAALLLLYAAPVLAQEGPGASTTLVDKLQRLQQLLALKKSPLAENLYYLQHASELVQAGIRELEMPEFPEWPAPLKPWSRVDLTHPVELAYNLGVFYLANGDPHQALSAFNQMLAAKPGQLKRPHQEAFIQVIKYLAAQKKGDPEVRPFIQLLLQAAEPEQLALLLDLGRSLLAEKRRDLAMAVLQPAMQIAEDYNQLLDLCADFQTEAPEIARQAILLGLSKARKNEEILQILEFSESRQAFVTEVLPQAVDHLLRLNRRPAGLLELADYFLQHQRPEVAQKFLQQAVAAANQTDTLIKLAYWAADRQFYQVAHDAIAKIFAAFPWPSFNPLVEPPRLASLDSQKPYALVPEKIRLYVFFGLLTQVLEGNKPYKAEAILAQAVNQEVTQMVARLGYKIEGDLNNFFYLKKVWELLGQEKQLARLLPVYEQLQEQYLQRLQRRQEQELENLREAIKERQKVRFEYHQQLEKARREAGQVQLKIGLYFCRLLALVVLSLLILLGCGVKAWRYSRKVSRYAALAGLAKFMECLGWVEVMAVWLFPLGFIKIGIAQLLQTWQLTQQGVEALCGAQSCPLPSPFNPLAPGEPVRFEPLAIFCPHCGKQQSEAAEGRFCEFCGQPLD